MKNIKLYLKGLSSIKGKMLLLIGIIILILITSSSWFSYNESRKVLQETLLHTAQDNAIYNSERISNVINEYLNIILNLDTSWTSSRDYLKDLDSEVFKNVYWINSRDYLVNIAKENESIGFLFISD